MYQTLLIVVAVLGTVVGMGLILTVIGLCIRWQKKSIVRTQCCWHPQTQSHDACSFYPSHQERIQMKCLQGCNNVMRRCCQTSLSNNNTGVSRGLGLGASCVNVPVPAPPAPRSWTPSPPYTCQLNDVQISRKNQSKVGEFSSHLQSQRVSTPESQCCDYSVHNNHLLFNTKEHSYCRFHSNTQLSSKYQPATNSKGEFRDIKVDANSAESENSSGVVDLSHSKMKARFHRKNKYLSHSSHNLSVRQKTNEKGKRPVRNQPSLFSHKNEQYERGVISNDHPAACSSYYTSPSKVPHSYAVQKPVGILRDNHNDAGLPNNLASPCQYQLANDLDKSQLHRNFDSHERSRRHENALPQIKEIASPATLFSATRSPNDNSVDKQVDDVFLHTARDSTAPEVNHSMSKKDELLKRDFSDKYGFCQACGHHLNPKEKHRGVQMITRSTQTCWGSTLFLTQVNQTQETTVDPTPSLSWDHLTPVPSPTYLHTVATRTARDDDIITEDDENELGNSCTANERNMESVVNSSTQENEAVGGW